MRLLVIGGSGMLGSDVVLEAQHRGFEVVAPSSSELNITDPESIAQIPFRTFGRFDYCVNCASYTAVDRAETEVQAATELNAIAPGYLANACAVAGINLIHISTDYVFDGTKDTPYTEDDPTNPLSVYGQTKLGGEFAVQEADASAVILRTSWLYGPNGNCFPRTMIRAWEAGKLLRVVADQFGCPTYTGDLAGAILDAAEKKLYPGVYHASGNRAMSWHEFAVELLTLWKSVSDSDRDLTVTPIATTDWPTPAQRPAYGVLSCEKLASNDIRLGNRGLIDFLNRMSQ